MKTFKLTPTDGRKSLNNHHVNQYESDGEEYSDLISYTKRVASYNHTTNEMSVYSIDSNSTLRHVRHFLAFYGYDVPPLKELKVIYNIK